MVEELAGTFDDPAVFDRVVELVLLELWDRILLQDERVGKARVMEAAVVIGNQAEVAVVQCNEVPLLVLPRRVTVAVAPPVDRSQIASTCNLFAPRQTHPHHGGQPAEHFDTEVFAEAVPGLKIAKRHLLYLCRVELVVGPGVAQRADGHAWPSPGSSVLEQHVETQGLTTTASYTVHSGLQHWVVILGKLSLVEVPHADIAVEDFVGQA